MTPEAIAELRRKNKPYCRYGPSCLTVGEVEALLAAAERLAEARALLLRLRAWDMMDVASDGRYWRGEIDKVLRAASVEV